MDETQSADTSPERPLSEPPPRMSDVRLGRYRLAFEMASGGMASLYVAVAESSGGFGKVLALKRIHPHLAKEAEFREMFIDEARTASLLHHPNVCGVLDYGEEDGLPFFTMEYLLGESLSRVHRVLRRMDEAPVAERARLAARIVADAAHGLHAAHELRDPEGKPLELVHRDVSPQNLIVTYDGVTRVLDFGIARSRAQEHHPATGTIKGKFAYMAPEQLLGEDVDRRADIWALGVVLWETLTGLRLFKRKTEMETLLAVTQGAIPEPTAVHPDLDPELCAVVKRALTREIEMRYATAEEMARDLERFLVKDGQLYGAPELAARMQELFPGGLERKRQLIADALARRPGPVPQIQTDSTSVSMPDIAIVDEPRRGGGRNAVSWVMGAIALIAVCGAAASFYWRPFAATQAQAPESEARLVPSLQQPPPEPQQVAPSLAHEDAAPSEADDDETTAPPDDGADGEDELADDGARAHARRRRARFARPAAAPVVDGRPTTPSAPAAPPEPADDGRQRPFLVESLDLGSARPRAREPEPSSNDRRRPLVVDTLGQL